MPLLEFWLVRLPMLIQRVVWTNSQNEILKFGPIALDGGPIQCCVFLSCRGPNQPFWPGWQPYSYSQQRSIAMKLDAHTPEAYCNTSLHLIEKIGHVPDRPDHAIIGILVGAIAHANTKGGLDQFPI